jgi:hypothetical protein
MLSGGWCFASLRLLLMRHAAHLCFVPEVFRCCTSVVLKLHPGCQQGIFASHSCSSRAAYLLLLQLLLDTGIARGWAACVKCPVPPGGAAAAA